MKEEIYIFVVMMFDIVYLLLLQFLNPVIIIFYSREQVTDTPPMKMTM